MGGCSTWGLGRGRDCDAQHMQHVHKHDWRDVQRLQRSTRECRSAPSAATVDGSRAARGAGAGAGAGQERVRIAPVLGDTGRLERGASAPVRKAAPRGLSSPQDVACDASAGGLGGGGVRSVLVSAETRLRARMGDQLPSTDGRPAACAAVPWSAAWLPACLSACRGPRKGARMRSGRLRAPGSLRLARGRGCLLVDCTIA